MSSPRNSAGHVVSGLTGAAAAAVVSACLVYAVGACGGGSGGEEGASNATAETGADASSTADAPSDASPRDSAPDHSPDSGPDGAPADGAATDGAPDAGGGPICGNAVREAAEQCDDGNTRNLDGCDSVCHFEQAFAITDLEMVFGGSLPACPNNALGSAIVLPQARADLGGSIATAEAQQPILLYLDPDTDLAGASPDGGTATVGAMLGTYPATNPLGSTPPIDWWYTPFAGTYDPAARLPKSTAGAILSPDPQLLQSLLVTQPMALSVDASFGGAPVTLSAFDVVLDGEVANAVGMAQSIVGNPPGHLPSENVDPSLMSYSTSSGSLCGDVAASSLAVPIPPAFATYLSVCGYTASNTLLDLVVGGCTFVAPIVTATQPDQWDTSHQPMLGAGGPYRLGTNGARQVSSCADASGAGVDLVSCLQVAGYSSVFNYQGKRGILKAP